MPITTRSFPTFKLTHSTEVTILRKSKGGYDEDGVWQEGTSVNVPIEANVQPMKYTEIMMLPESDRTKEWISIWSVSEIRSANEGEGGWDADEILWDGKTYKVMKSQRWQMGVLDHFSAKAAREPISAR